MSHLDVQKYICYENDVNSFNFSCTGSHKRLWIVLCQEMTGRVFLAELGVF